jgi:hypothetical protein
MSASRHVSTVVFVPVWVMFDEKDDCREDRRNGLHVWCVIFQFPARLGRYIYSFNNKLSRSSPDQLIDKRQQDREEFPRRCISYLPRGFSATRQFYTIQFLNGISQDGSENVSLQNV